MLNPILVVIAAIGGVIAVYFLFRKMQLEDEDIIKKLSQDATIELRRSVWMGGMIRHAIFSLSILAAGAAAVLVNNRLYHSGSRHYSIDIYYLAGGLALVGIYWFVMVIRKYVKEEKKWRE